MRSIVEGGFALAHPLVLQLRFTRSEFSRALSNISEEDAKKRVLPLNCISWTVGHLAWQEQRYFLFYPNGKYLIQEIQDNYRNGAPSSTPSLSEMLKAWTLITNETEGWIESMTTEKLQEMVIRDGKATDLMYGNLLQRVIYHYWYHTGENMAVRRILGHTGLGQFVGDIDEKAPYTPE
jgi:uncharacterized damage-inducible protein DinB